MSNGTVLYLQLIGLTCPSSPHSNFSTKIQNRPKKKSKWQTLPLLTFLLFTLELLDDPEVQTNDVHVLGEDETLLEFKWSLRLH